jgi:FAD/FMN-containing dehydrogenase
LIDLSSLNDIILSPDHKAVSVGPGAKWEVIYEELEKHELTVAGGRAAGVGVGGLITGGNISLSHTSIFFGHQKLILSHPGGMSHFSNFWGLACDQVKEFEASYFSKCELAI